MTDYTNDRLSQIVTENGPKPLTDKCSIEETHEAIILCIEHLLTSRVPLEIMRKLEAKAIDEERQRRFLEKELEKCLKQME